MGEEPIEKAHEVDGRADVYALGVVLYRLLTGELPFRGTTRMLLHQVRHDEPRPPRRLNDHIHRDLETICLKAMAKEPSGRYRTARELSVDLRRWLDGEPILARPAGSAEKVWRWTRRHPTAAALSLVAIVAIFALSASGYFVAANIRLEKSRQESKKHLQLGLEISDLLVVFGDRQLITRMSPAKRDRFLRTAFNFIQKFREREPGDQTVQVQTAQVARRLANLLRLTGKFNEADPFYSEALLILENLAKQSPNSQVSDLLAETLLDQGDAWITRGRATQAEVVFQKAVGLARENVEASPKDLVFQRPLARGISRVGSSHLALGRTDVVTLNQEAVSIAQPLAEIAWPTIKEKVISGEILPLTDQLDLIQARYTLAEGWEQAGRPDEAESQLRQAIKLTYRLATRFQGFQIAEIDFFQSRVETRLARLLAQGPKNDESLRLLDEAVTRLENLVNRNSDTPDFIEALAGALAARAVAHERSQSIAKAKVDAEASQKVLTPLLNDYRDIPDYANLMAVVFAAQGRLARREGADPTVLFEKAIQYQKAAATSCRENSTFAKRLAEYEAFLKE